VCAGGTGHAEAVEVTYDPDQVTYEDLLAVFWKTHNPTAGPGRQDDDSQYRSAIFYHSEAQKLIAEASRKRLQESGRYRGRIVTRILPAPTFFRAEEYHQRYLEKQGRTGRPREVT